MVSFLNVLPSVKPLQGLEIAFSLFLEALFFHGCRRCFFSGCDLSGSVSARVVSIFRPSPPRFEERTEFRWPLDLAKDPQFLHSMPTPWFGVFFSPSARDSFFSPLRDRDVSSHLPHASLQPP